MANTRHCCELGHARLIETVHASICRREREIGDGPRVFASAFGWGEIVVSAAEAAKGLDGCSDRTPVRLERLLCGHARACGRSGCMCAALSLDDVIDFGQFHCPLRSPALVPCAVKPNLLSVSSCLPPTLTLALTLIGLHSVQVVEVCTTAIVVASRAEKGVRFGDWQARLSAGALQPASWSVQDGRRTAERTNGRSYSERSVREPSERLKLTATDVRANGRRRGWNRWTRADVTRASHF